MNAYKLFMLDVGLLGALSELPATSIFEENDIIMEQRKLRFSALKYMDQEWMVNIPLYAVCNL